MSKARTLANLISDNAELADGQISVAEVVGAAPTANPTFTGTVNISSSENNVALFDSSHATSTQMFLRNTNTGTGLYTVLGFAPSNSVSGATITTYAEEDFSEAANRTARLEIDTRDNGNWFNRLTLGRLEAVFNDGSDATDFRVESDTNANAIFMNAGNGTTAFGTTSDNYNHASNEGIYLSPGSSSSFTANSPPIRVNRNGTGGNDRSNIEFYNNGAIRGWVGSLGAEDGIFLYANGSRGMHLYSDEMVVNQDSHDYDFRVESNNATHMLYVDSTYDRIGINTNTPAHMLNLAGSGDVGIHIQADTDNSGENDNPYLSMSQDGSSAQQLKIGMVGEAGQEFTGSVANAAFIHANNNSDQPLQLAHFGDAVVDFYRTGAVFNQAGRDQDFRIESDSNANALFVNAGSSEVFMGINSQADTGARLHVSVAGNVGIEVSEADTTGFYGLWFARAGVQKGYTQTTGSGTTYNTGSDVRLKENVSTITDGIDVLNRMRAVEFDWIDEDDAPRTRGFIAQEMVDVAPESVSGDPDGEIMMGMDYGRITPVIVAALQEAITKIETLEARITALENA